MTKGSESIRVGLVLGAGGASGSAYIRVALEAITAATGWRPESSATVVGTSAGAFRAALVKEAGRPTSAVEAESLQNLCVPTDWLDVSAATGPLCGLRRVGARVVGLLKRSSAPPVGYDVAPPPYHSGAVVVTVDRRSGQRVVHRLDEAEDPKALVWASAAIPIVSQPVTLDGREHVDGAVHSATNADLVSPDEHDMIIVISPMVSKEAPGLTMFDREQLKKELAPWKATTKPLVLITPTLADRRLRDSKEAFAETARREIQGRIAAQSVG